VTGHAYGPGFPLVNPVQPVNGGFYDAFLAVLNAAGTALEFSTYLGGTGHEKGRGLGLDRLGNAYVVGETFSSDFPTARALEPAYAGGAFDGFMVKFALGGSPVLHIAPGEIDFGLQRVGTTSAAQVVTLTNIGGGDLVIEAITATGDFTPSSDCAPLAPGLSCDVSLTFTPSVSGTRAGMLTISHNGSEPVGQAALSGTGIAPEMTLSASSVSFGHQLIGTESGPQTITLTNSGTASLELSGIAVSGEFAESNDCPARIEIAGSCTITVTFAPKTTGDRAGGLTITNSLPQETRSASLSGTGTDFFLAGSPGEATVAAGETATFTLTLTPAGGFHEMVSLVCSGVPKAASCAVTPASFKMDSERPADAKVTVTTKARAMTPPSARPGSSRDWPHGAHRFVPFLWLFMASLLVEGRRRIKKYVRAARQTLGVAGAALALFVVFWTAACGGGGRKVSPPPPDGTPAGTYTLTLTGSYDGVSRSTAISLTVK
jgi:hypothetical protein